VVKSSVGHVRDLPTGASRTPIDPKERAKQAAATRKMSPEEKQVHREKKRQKPTL
jgi:DNA topoisomerase-1